ncbi:hypothetical protein BCF33_1761 [Hasllibacter halocynthiae]|uniref:Uncharacterized protein n=1 Tax=Hasllibacter halocynthiae TaxID=595589 RepID=A0A2T0X1T1_9RHOB|nr:hypothetical protein [Hasllibacter halocynthiae]PRY92898.1 hypothetical protein BCF33_1761 [Hasllibacter halocynthiae]
MDTAWNDVGIIATVLVFGTLLIVLFLTRLSKRHVEKRRDSDRPKSTLAADAPSTRPGDPVD